MMWRQGAPALAARDEAADDNLEIIGAGDRYGVMERFERSVLGWGIDFIAAARVVQTVRGFGEQPRENALHDHDAEVSHGGFAFLHPGRNALCPASLTGKAPSA